MSHDGQTLLMALRALLHPDPNEPPPRVAPMAHLTIRFDGSGLDHVGAAVARACDQYFEHVGDARPRWLFGSHPKATTPVTASMSARKAYGHALAMVRAPKDLRTRAGRTFLRDRLEEIAALPDHDSVGGDLATLVHPLNFAAHDGPKPWAEPGCEVPERAALRIGLGARDHKHTPAGTFAVAFALSELEDPARRATWLTFGDALFTSLRASVGWLGPALWGIPRTIVTSGNLGVTKRAFQELHERFPQVDLPTLYSGNSDIYNPSLQPAPARGLLGVSWTQWLDAALAPKVVDFPGALTKLERGGARWMVEEAPPWSMSKERHARYCAAKRALRPVLLTYQDDDDARVPRYLQRFEGESSSAS